jgi:hypothetical protein
VDLTFPALLLVTIVAVAVGLARPWELRGGSFLTKLRIGEAVSGYDFWLSLRGVPSRRRRELRAELRANLWEASQRVGVKRALAAVGPMRRLASESVPQRRSPSWGYGVAAGAVALELVVVAQVLLSLVVADAAQAASVERLDVPVTLFPGMRTVYETLPGGGFSIETSFGPVPLVVGLVVLLVVARPWLLLRRPTRQPA